jgi:putative transcriptional regulator
MIETSNLTNQLLIAMPALEDPHFSHTVTYICEHNDEGTMGIVINRHHELTLGTLLSQMNIEALSDELKTVPLYDGGPVNPEHGFVLHRPVGDWEVTLPTEGDIGLTASRDIIEAIARGEGPEEFIIALGYAGWGAGQLEQEILDNSWLAGPANEEIVFQSPTSERWTSAAQLLGVDITLLPTDAGHA